jgi:SSS family solute:Na+ symporter
VINEEEWADATTFTNLVDGKNSWLCEFSPVTDPNDLSLAAGYVKHTSKGLFFAFNVTDNIHFGTDIPLWAPKGNPNANLVNASGWAFFGDEMEILLNAAGPTADELDVAGNATQWQMVMNTGKSTLGGVGVGGLMPGDRPAASYERYLSWIESGAQKAMATVHSKGYSIEWFVAYELLMIKPGMPYAPSMPDTTMGINIALGDVDTPADGHPFYGIRHEQWFSGEKTNRTQINEFGTLVLKHGPRTSSSA